MLLLVVQGVDVDDSGSGGGMELVDEVAHEVV